MMVKHALCVIGLVVVFGCVGVKPPTTAEKVSAENSAVPPAAVEDLKALVKSLKARKNVQHCEELSEGPAKDCWTKKEWSVGKITCGPILQVDSTMTVVVVADTNLLRFGQKGMDKQPGPWGVYPSKNAALAETYYETSPGPTETQEYRWQNGKWMEKGRSQYWPFFAEGDVRLDKN